MSGISLPFVWASIRLVIYCASKDRRNRLLHSNWHTRAHTFIVDISHNGRYDKIKLFLEIKKTEITHSTGKQEMNSKNVNALEEWIY